MEPTQISSTINSKSNEDAGKTVPPINRQRIEEVCKSFFQDEVWRPNYFRLLEEVEDPFCTLDDDLLYDNIGVECEDDFVWKVQRLSQVYAYLERRFITERGKPPRRQNFRYKSNEEQPNESKSSDKITIMFPGQGAQKVGMAKDVVKTSSAARRLFDEAQKILGYDIWKICTEGPEEKLDSTEICQPAVFVCSLAAMEKFKQDNPNIVENCVSAAGLSLGEYAALVFAEALTFEDALKVVKVRGEAMQKAADMTKTGMISVLGQEIATVEAIVEQASTKGKIKIANYLCPGNCVLAGDEPALKEVEVICTNSKRTFRRLKVSGAFHTEYMQPAYEALSKVLSDALIVKPRFPVILNFDGKPHDDPEEIRSLLARQLCSPVMWEQSMNFVLDSGVSKIYEVGTGQVLIGLMKHIQKKRTGTPVDVHNFSV